jgi:hypothetical protein
MLQLPNAGSFVDVVRFPVILAELLPVRGEREP